MYAIMFIRLFNQFTFSPKLLMECLIAFVIPILSLGIGLASASLVAYWHDGISPKQFLSVFVCLTGTAYFAFMGICRYARRVKISFLSAGLFPLTAIVTSSEQSHNALVRRPRTSQAFPDYISFSPPQQKPSLDEKPPLDYTRLSSPRRRY